MDQLALMPLWFESITVYLCRDNATRVWDGSIKVMPGTVNPPPMACLVRFQDVPPTNSGCSEAWLSRLVWDQETLSSNLSTPTKILGGSVTIARSHGILALPPRSCVEWHPLCDEVGLWGADM